MPLRTGGRGSGLGHNCVERYRIRSRNLFPLIFAFPSFLPFPLLSPYYCPTFRSFWPLPLLAAMGVLFPHFLWDGNPSQNWIWRNSNVKLTRVCSTLNATDIHISRVFFYQTSDSGNACDHSPTPPLRRRRPWPPVSDQRAHMHAQPDRFVPKCNRRPYAHNIR